MCVYEDKKKSESRLLNRKPHKNDHLEGGGSLFFFFYYNNLHFWFILIGFHGHCLKALLLQTQWTSLHVPRLFPRLMPSQSMFNYLTILYVLEWSLTDKENSETRAVRGPTCGSEIYVCEALIDTYKKVRGCLSLQSVPPLPQKPWPLVKCCQALEISSGQPGDAL